MTEPTERGSFFSGRKFVCLLLTLLFLVMVVSGIVLFVTPKERVAQLTGWTMLGLDKDQWRAVHATVAVVLLIVAPVHLFLRWRARRREPGKETAGRMPLRELVAALLLVAIVLGGTIGDVMPFSQVARVERLVKAYWAYNATQVRDFNVRDLSLRELADQLNLPVDDVKLALEKEGYDVESIEAKIDVLAEKRGKLSGDVIEAILNHHPDAARQGPGRKRTEGREVERTPGERIDQLRDRRPKPRGPRTPDPETPPD